MFMVCVKLVNVNFDSVPIIEIYNLCKCLSHLYMYVYVGYWNGDPLDDFKFRNGTILWPSGGKNITEAQQFQFGQSCTLKLFSVCCSAELNDYMITFSSKSNKVPLLKL